MLNLKNVKKAKKMQFLIHDIDFLYYTSTNKYYTSTILYFNIILQLIPYLFIFIIYFGGKNVVYPGRQRNLNNHSESSLLDQLQSFFNITAVKLINN
jgi:hypothetical protein